MNVNKNKNDDDFDYFSNLDDVDTSDLDLDFDDDLDDLNDDFTFGKVSSAIEPKKKKFSFFKRRKKKLSKFDIIASEDETFDDVDSFESENKDETIETDSGLESIEETVYNLDDDNEASLEDNFDYNQETSEQDESQNKKHSNNSFFDRDLVISFLPKIIIPIVAILVICVLVSRFGNPFDGIISKFSSDDKQTQTLSEKLDNIEFNEETNIVPLEDAQTTNFANFENGIIACKSNYLAYYKKNGEVDWEINTLVVDPIMSVNGQYILIAENSGTWLYLYKGNKLLYSTEAFNPIIGASVSAEGDCVLTTQKPFYKGAIEAYNTAGVCIFSHSFGKDYVVSSAISPRSRTIAVALMNTTEKVTSHVELFDITLNKSHTDINFNYALLCGLEYNMKGLTCYTDTGVYGFNTKGDPIWKHEYSEKLQFQKYNHDEYGNKIALISKSDKPELHIYNRYGSEKKSYLLDDFPDNINIYDGLFIYSSNRTIVFGKYSFPHQCAASMEVKGVYVIDSSNCMVVYSNSIEFIKS